MKSKWEQKTTQLLGRNINIGNINILDNYNNCYKIITRIRRNCCCSNVLTYLQAIFSEIICIELILPEQLCNATFLTHQKWIPAPNEMCFSSYQLLSWYYLICNNNWIVKNKLWEKNFFLFFWISFIQYR